jgi:hypothetical protein
VSGSDDARIKILVLDLVQHLVFIFSALSKCVGEDESSGIPSMLRAYNYILKWRELDPLSSGLPVGPQGEPELSSGADPSIWK